MLHTLRKNLSPAFCPCEDTSYPLRSDHLRNLIENLSVSDHAPVILCVGTDRIIGDSLGPMVGTMLMKLAQFQRLETSRLSLWIAMGEAIRVII